MGYTPQTHIESEVESGSSNGILVNEKKTPHEGMYFVGSFFVLKTSILCEVVTTKWGLDPRLFNLTLTLKQS